MHEENIDISIQDLSKIEGHAGLDVRVRNNEVKEVKLQFTENKRFFTQAIRGQNIETLPQSVARICGTCSIAHTLCCIKAVEHALSLEVSEQTALLRKLTMYGLMIRDHALHIYLFSLPDVFRKDSVLDFDRKESKFLYDAFAIKKAGNMLDTIIAGRAVHAPFPVVGGFASIPEKKQLQACIKPLQEAREKVFAVLDIYYGHKADYTRATDFVALTGKEFNFLEGDIQSSSGLKVREEDYLSYLERTVIPYSQAVGYKFKEDTYMVGALARLNLNKEALHKDTKKDAGKFLKVFPSRNIFYNNLAQGIEIVHSIDSSLEIIESSEFRQEEPLPVAPKECEGVGIIEAPRGTLFYSLDINRDGIIKNGTIIVPTQQNQINMELDIKNLVQKQLGKLSQHDIEYEIEKLIRCYDPCISCATHFLKVRWL